MKKFWKRLSALWHRDQLERDLEDELSFHLAMKASETGDAPSAHRSFGNATAFKESCRELWLFSTLDSLSQDVRYAARTLRRSPLVTGVAIVALALGIGINTTVFTVIGSALRFDMGVDRIDRVVTLMPGETASTSRPQPTPDIWTLRREVKTIASLAAYRFTPVNLSDSHALPERCSNVQMTASGWAMVKPKPALGRGFVPADELPSAAPAVLLSYRVWRRRYGGDASILNQTVRVDDVPRTVIGVMPPGAQFPEDADIWTPLTITDALAASSQRGLLIFGRLAEGATLVAARAEVDAVARRVYPNRAGGHFVNVSPFLQMIGVYDSRALLIAVMFAVGFVLLIVCADVANLLLARAAARSREIAVRIAIGAGRARVIRQLLIESVMLAAAGGIGGWLVAVPTLRWFDGMTEGGHRPSWIHFSMDTRAFLYLAGVSIGAGIIFGLAPALQLARTDVNSAIKDGGRSAEGGRRGRRLSGILVAGQMALCVVLLAGAGLMIHSTVNLYAAPMGFDARNVVKMRISLSETKYPSPAAALAFQQTLKSQIAAIPGVVQVALASNLPLAGSRPFRVECEGQSPSQWDGRSPSVVRQPSPPTMSAALLVDENYFRTLQIPVEQGRTFTRDDDAAVVVNQAFAARFWPGEPAIGKRLRPVSGDAAHAWLTVAGVVHDVEQDLFQPLAHTALVYLPESSQPLRDSFVIARTSAPPQALVEPFRRAVQALDENLPAQDAAALSNFIEERRLNITSFEKLFTLFATVALLLASIGLYAVIAHAVSRRTQEIGIRMAMGGARRDIFSLVLKQGMRHVAYGFLAGLPLAFALTRVLKRLLVGVSPADPATFLAVALVLGAAGALGCAIPARRAVRVDPLTALRHE
jgi:putative ABC transport system permease protein